MLRIIFWLPGKSLGVFPEVPGHRAMSYRAKSMEQVATTAKAAQVYHDAAAGLRRLAQTGKERGTAGDPNADRLSRAGRC